MTIEDLLSRLDKVAKDGEGYKARCPAHEDRNPSLSIGQGREGILLHCHAGCSTEAVCSALGITTADLFTEKRNGSSKAEIVAEYDYTDEGGKVLFQVVRMLPKDFRQRRPDPSSIDGWNWSTKGTRKVLYRLPKIVDAVKRGLPILITEGEKDVAALEKHGFTATCNPGGAGKWIDEYSEALRGADVVIVPDNDDPGRKHAELVSGKLQGIAKRVRVVTLSTGKDAHDFFAAGKDAGDLVALIDAAKSIEPPKTFADLVAERRFDINRPPPKIDPIFFINEITIATAGNLQTINAQVKSGKSAIINALMAAPMAREGADTLGVRSENLRGFGLLHVDTEQSPEDHHAQVLRAMRRAEVEALPPWFWSFCLTGFDAPSVRRAVFELADQLAQVCGGMHSILLDGVADCVRDPNDAEECNEFIAALHALAIRLRCAIPGVIHQNPNSDKTRGHLGSQLERKAETNLRLDKVEEITEVWSEKQRRAPILKGTGPRFRWSDEAGMHISVQSGREARSSAQFNEAKELVAEVFKHRPAMPYAALVNGITEGLILSVPTAKRRITTWITLGVIRKTVGGYYEPAP